MTDSKCRTITGMCVVRLIDHIMRKHNISCSVAFKKLLKSELYDMLLDPDSRLYLETSKYLCDAYDMEEDYGREAYIWFINSVC